MKRHFVVGFTLVFLVSLGQAQTPPQARDSATATHRRVFVDGTAIPPNRVVLKDGVEYVDASVLATALGAGVQSGDDGLMIVSGPSKGQCDKVVADGQRFSQEFRSEIARVPDEIESLRVAVMKKDSPALGPRFDEIEKQLTLSTALVQTDADTAVYYALSFANNSLAIAYYQQARGVPFDEAQKDQLDSIMCSMESKFALMKGVLLPGGSCSVLKRIELKKSSKTVDQ